jgi:hypothetical protein
MEFACAQPGFSLRVVFGADEPIMLGSWLRASSMKKFSGPR